MTGNVVSTRGDPGEDAHRRGIIRREDRRSFPRPGLLTQAKQTTSPLTLTGSFVAVPGAAISILGPGNYLVFATMRINSSPDAGLVEGELYQDGTSVGVGRGQAHPRDSTDAQIASKSYVWIVTVEDVPSLLTLRAKTTGGGVVTLLNSGTYLVATSYIGGGPPGAAGGVAHDAVTLAAAAQLLFDLSGQEIDLDTQAANEVLAGPTSGGDAKPAFRALVSDDIPAAFLTVTEGDARYAPIAADRVSKSYLFTFPAVDLAVGDFISDTAIRLPAAGKHGDITWGTAYARCTVVGAGTNTILFRTSTTLTGLRSTRATINLGSGREASGAITLAESDGMYLWVECSAVGGTAPKKVTVQVDCEEEVH